METFKRLSMAEKEADLRLMLIANVHLGAKNCDLFMRKYALKQTSDGVFIINLKETWEKLELAARIIVATENPEDVVVQSSRPDAQDAVMKFAELTGVHPVAGRRFLPSTYTNHCQPAFRDPRLLIVADPRADFQAMEEAASHGNVRIVAFCDTDSPLNYVGIAIPGNNKGKNSVACLFWVLTKMVLRMRGVVRLGKPWKVAVDDFICRKTEVVITKKENEEGEDVVEFHLDA
ncbi:PREDICTED: 40S ribosomal protein SA-like [Nelumbo nucifera]|uniref:Small ribosomal subunit protein uS2 n=2 Tax=Nelumbo nucifera TaxID=4432 RepID=A0A822XW16_NELNU|nr:PREDICTED: 40S ribosomal protein SA-like [Nelumbo nucifera]DAD23933.1 TPA_asm: hypothetical protein HUJ06_025396 [Nelumbo nucifera]